MGRLHAEAIVASPHATLEAVCDIRADQATTVGIANQAKSYPSYHAMLDAMSLDVLTVATPDDVHVEPAMAAIQRGLHVFCEKPLARTLKEADWLAEAAQDRGVFLGVNYNRRFGFGYRRAKQLLDSPSALPPRQAILQVSDGVPSPLADQPHALLTSLVSHHLDLLRWFGGDFRSLMATMQGPSPEHPHAVTIVLVTENGMTGNIHAIWRAGQSRTVEHLCLMTDDQVISVDDVQHEVIVWDASPDVARVFRPNCFKEGNRFFDTVTFHVDAFLEAIAEDRPPPVTARDGCATLQYIEAAIESHRTGRWIDTDRENES
jgi:predicted dehydrogenase